MNRNEKFIKKLSRKEQQAVIDIVLSLQKGKFEKYDVKKLSGHKHLYRIRHGSIRILFTLMPSGPEIIYIGKRDENTYRNFK